MPSILLPEESSKRYRKNWARLIPQMCANAIDFNYQIACPKGLPSTFTYDTH